MERKDNENNSIAWTASVVDLLKKGLNAYKYNKVNGKDIWSRFQGFSIDTEFPLQSRLSVSHCHMDPWDDCPQSLSIAATDILGLNQIALGPLYLQLCAIHS